MSLVNAYVIYNGTTNEFVGDKYVTATINCVQLSAFSPRPVWLKRFLAPGDGTVMLYEPTFSPTSDELLDSNILAGYWIEQDGQDLMIDAQTLASFTDACDACCGDTPSIVPSNWNGKTPAFTNLTLNTFCIYRFDNGTAGDHDAFAWDYAGNYVGTAKLRSNFSNVSHYTIQSYWTLAQFTALLVGTDTIYTGACSS